MSIVVEGLVKVYGEQKAVDSISFCIQKGEIIGFLGPNGAGKSTTMKMITGYLLPDQGSIKVCGIDVGIDPIGAKRKIGYLPEANPLYMDMYIKEYLDFIGGIHHLSNKQKRINEVIGLTGLGVEQHKKIGQLSKGYKQRTGLAAALIHDPEVLILDEPTTGLDPNQIIEIRNVIKAQGANKTVLFSSHILQEVQAICDRVIIRNKGALVADDKLAALQQKSNSNIVKVTFGEIHDPALLRGLIGVTELRIIDNYSYQLETTNENEIKKQLLELSLKHHLNIVSLQTEGSSLEDIFRKLTVASK
jgi:ABC-2 type transport system ATP-binding protein